MTFVFDNLDPVTRNYMLREFEGDIAGAGLYLSDRLSAAGSAGYPELLKRAIMGGDDDTFSDSLGAAGVLNAMEAYAKGMRKVRADANRSLGEGEFNRYYIRGVCARVVAEGGTQVEVYRGRESGWHRPGSDALIGTALSAQSLLNDLRANHLTPEGVIVLPDVGSGLTVRMV